MSTLRYIEPEGHPVFSNIAFVGEAPGREEEAQGRPFVGRAGQLLRNTLTKLNLTPRNTYITNVVRVRPPENRTPTVDELKSWAPLLWRELSKMTNVRVIVTLGNCATQAVLDNYDIRISRYRGKPLAMGSKAVIPTWHPAYVLRNPNVIEDFETDLWSAIDLMSLPKEGS